MPKYKYPGLSYMADEHGLDGIRCAVPRSTRCPKCDRLIYRDELNFQSCLEDEDTNDYVELPVSCKYCEPKAE